MRKRYLYGSGIVLLAILTTLIVWQMSFSFGDYGPTSLEQTFVFWAVSTLIFLLAVTVGFMLFRTFVKLYLERERNREGSRMQSKLVAGALALSLLPVVFLVAFSYIILNRNIEKWFQRPVEGIKTELQKTADSFSEEAQGRAQALANWLALMPDVRSGTANFSRFCNDFRIAELRLDDPSGKPHILCGKTASGDSYRGRAPVPGLGTIQVRVEPRVELAREQNIIDQFLDESARLDAEKKSIRSFYLSMILLIALFILFVATWIALLLSRQISRPILALLEAASEVRKGNLAYRVSAAATDEMASLVRAFNEMTQGLEANSIELESRRRFTEAILESIPTGVISLASDGRIQRVNRAMRGLFTEDQLERAVTVTDLLTPEHTAEVLYLMKRARRTGVASSQIDLHRAGQVLHLAVTVSALPNVESGPGYVVVVEDSSELLRAQKAAAWHEVARRIAHELKNPLTPIALSAERIARQLDRGPITPEAERVLRQCSATIAREVESVKALADEFSQFSRFPAAQLVAANFNDIVKNALDVFAGRLEGIDLRVDLAPDLPLVNVDPEQMKRVVVNLVDNAAEAMRDSMLRRLLVATRATSPDGSPADTVELLVADTGRGVSSEDKEKLFLPYFSTKERGTGLGLAIVSHILAEHGSRIRVEENRPAGTRFYVEIPVVLQDTITLPPDGRVAQVESGVRT
ncbi:MAG: ATP-binding protein [Acidobacteriota bacterium]